MTLSFFRKIRPTLATWALALLFTSIAVKLVGDSPLLVLKVLGTSAAGTAENFSYTLFYATPMLLTGTAVALALEAGLFNIGAEGQLYMGGVFAAAWGIYTRGLPPMVSVLGGALFGFLGGAIWGALAGFLKTKRNVHEVIATIMLNFLAMAFANWAILNPLKNLETQNLETIGISEGARIAPLWLHTTWGFVFAVLIAGLVLGALRYSWWGFRVRATGQNSTAADLAGVNVSRTSLLALGLSGGIAGLVGFHEVFMHSYKMLDSFSPGYGFTGLAVALLARGNFAMLVIASLLFGALHKGALDLDLETEKVTRDLSAVIQALILVALAAEPKIAALLAKHRKTAT